MPASKRNRARVAKNEVTRIEAAAIDLPYLAKANPENKKAQPRG